MRIVLLATDAYYAGGGIAQFNRDFLRAAASYSGVSEIVLLELAWSQTGLRHTEIPSKIRIVALPGRGKLAFVSACLKSMFAIEPGDLLVCGHIHLLPVAVTMKLFCRARMLLIVHGTDVWTVSHPGLKQWELGFVDRVASVSRYTAQRMAEWAPEIARKISVFPNTVDLERFTAGAPDAVIAQRYVLAGKRVILTVSRLDARERYKGIDRVIQALPFLLTKYSNIVYLVAGDGTDRPRLENLVAELGLGQRVIFAGQIAEDEKVRYYRSADVFAMPSTGEGFGIVFLEAAATGIPVVAGGVDGSRDALMEGRLGQLVDPFKPEELAAALDRALQLPKHRPEAITYLSHARFTERMHALLEECMR